jgi:EF hand
MVMVTPRVREEHDPIVSRFPMRSKGVKTMNRNLLVAASLLVLTGTTNLEAQEAPANQSMMGHGMMGYGMGHGMKMRPNIMRVVFVLMDTDGDGALSLEEVQTVHARMFKAIDADKNGRVTLEEMQQFMRGQ